MKKGLALTLMALVFALHACGGGGGGSGSGSGTNIEGVRLTGKLSAPSGAAFLSSNSTQNSTQPNAVWAVPITKIQGANIDPINVYLRKTTTFSSDGSFSFDLPKSMTVEELEAKFPDIEISSETDSIELDWVIVTVNTATNPVTVLDMIQLKESTGYDSLMLLPISSFTENSFDLGQITRGDAEKTTGTIETVSTVTGDALKTLSRADNIMRSLKNVIQNCDIRSEKCKEATQSFAFTGNYDNIGTNYDKANSYSGYQFYLDLNDYYDPRDFDGICPGTGAATIIYTLTPPADVSIRGTTYGPNNPLTTGSAQGVQETRGTNEMVCSQGKENVFIWKRKDSTDQWKEWGLQFITGDSPQELTTQMPSGQWILKRNDEQIAQFEFILADPVDSNGNPLIFVPEIRLRKDGSDVASGDPITHVEVKWYRWDDSENGYMEITGENLAMLDDLAGNFELSFQDFDRTTDFGQRSVNWWNLSFKDDISIDVSNPDDGKGEFYYNHSDTNKYLAKYIGIYYQFGGQGFRFAWKMPDNN